MGLIRETLGAWGWLPPTETQIARSGTPYPFDQWLADSFRFGPNQYSFGAGSKTGSAEEIAASFAGYVQACYHRNGVVAACMLARESLFAEARFMFRRLRSGRPGDLFSTPEREILDRPSWNETTGDLLVRMEQDSTIGGGFFARRQRDRIIRMRPDWTSIVLGSNTDPDDPAFQLDAEVIGYAFHPGGYNSGREIVPLRREEVVHYAPRKDPLSVAAGVSLLTSVLTDVAADEEATDLKTRFFHEGGATTIGVVPIPDPQKFKTFVESFRQMSAAAGPYERLFLQQGIDFQTIGANLKEMEFKAVQGAGETRIAAALGVPPVIVGLSEGLEAATYSNYALAMRRFADLTMRPLWRKAAASLAAVIAVPSGAELWYDDRDIPALKDDIVNRAEVQVKQATASKLYGDAGFIPDSVVAALNSDDMTLLEHSGLSSVQLQPIGQNTNGSTNGKPAENEEEESTVAERAAAILEGVTS